MGRKSREKWEARRKPMPSYDLETRWGTTPLARAFGGMVQGLFVGGFFAIFCLGIGALRILFAGAPPEMDGLAGEFALFVGGMLLGGAVSGALAPLRRRIGRYTQGVVFFGVAILVWMPILDEHAPMPLAGKLALWLSMSALYGVLLGKHVSETLEPAPPHVQMNYLDPNFRSGRHHKFR